MTSGEAAGDSDSAADSSTSGPAVDSSPAVDLGPAVDPRSQILLWTQTCCRLSFRHFNSRTQAPLQTPACLDVGLPADGLAEIWDAIIRKVMCSDVS